MIRLAIMRKNLYLCLLFICLFLSGCIQKQPHYNNDDPAEDLISIYYEEEDIQAIINEEYEDLYQLMNDYTIECIRKPKWNPNCFSQDNMYGYVLLLTTTGGELFVIFDDSTTNNEICKCLYVKRFMPASEMKTILENDLSEVLSMNLLNQFDTGFSTGARRWENYIVVQEGVYVISRSNGDHPVIHEIQFYPDELLFGDDTSDLMSKYYEFAPILPIDKN